MVRVKTRFKRRQSESKSMPLNTMLQHLIHFPISSETIAKHPKYLSPKEFSAERISAYYIDKSAISLPRYFKPFLPMTNSSTQHLFNKCILTANYVLGTILSTKSIIPTLMKLTSNGRNRG